MIDFSKLSAPTKLQSILIWVGNIIFLVIAVAILLHWGDWRRFLALLARIQLQWLIFAFLLQLGTYFCMALIWKFTLGHCDISISKRNLFALSLAKLFFDQVLPSFGMSGNLVVMHGFIRRKCSAGVAAAAVVINTTSRYLPYFILFIIAIGIVWKNQGMNRGLEYLTVIFFVVIMAITAGIFAIIKLTKNKKIPRFLHKIRWLNWLIETIHEIPKKTLGHWGLWTVGCVANAAIFLLDSATLWALLASLGVLNPSWSHAYATFMIASVITDLAFIPGKVGVFEGSLVAFLRLFQVPFEEALAAVVLFRGLTFWLPMIPGFLISQRELQKKSHH